MVSTRMRVTSAAPPGSAVGSVTQSLGNADGVPPGISKPSNTYVPSPLTSSSQVAARISVRYCASSVVRAVVKDGVVE